MDAKLVEFSNLLRQNGLRVSLAESMDMLRALDVVGLPDRETVRATLRATMVKRTADLPTFEQLFALFFSGLADAMKELTAATAGALEISEAELQRLMDELQRLLEEGGIELSPLARALLTADAGASAVGPSGSSRSFWSVHVCRAGFAGRGTTFALLTGRHTLAVPPDPRQGLGSR